MSDAQPTNVQATEREQRPRTARRNRIVFCIVVIAWLVLDRATKVFFEQYGVDLLSAPAIEGVVEFRLVHNFGAAWGSFSGMVDGLIVVTTILCLAIGIYALLVSKGASLLEMVGLALLFAGGIGNLVDRIVNGYVIDFIAPLFIDFPTFNIADVGITCGIVCVLISLVGKIFGSKPRAHA